MDGVGEVPDDKSIRHTVEALGEYKIRKNMSVGLSYQYENFLSNDFATDTVDSASTSLDRVLLLSASEADYEGHLSMVYVTYTFDKL